MMDRDPGIGTGFDTDAEPIEVFETLENWTGPVREKKMSDEERLAIFLETLSKSDRQAHDVAQAGATNPVGRRNAARLRLSLPARFIAVEETHKAILLNLSRTGAQIAILNSVREGEGGFLECGQLKVFAIIARSEFGINALEFEEPLTDQAVLDIRRYSETVEERERRHLLETARQWVNGESKDERAI
ncbi:MAG: hypothetical protein AAF251_18145 [Pseudomonadota bacterium]